MIFAGETAKKIRLNTLFDLTQATEITLLIRKPSGATVALTKTGGDVTVGSVDISEASGGPMLAGQYVEYKAQAGVLDETGRYHLQVRYQNDAETPPASFYSKIAALQVEGVLLPI